MKFSGARYFMRREDHQPGETVKDSPFRKFNVNCVKCQSFKLRLEAEFDESAGHMTVTLVCTSCHQREQFPIAGS